MKTHLLLLAALTSSACNAEWFANTPLQDTYQALIEGHPERAWQELHLALGNQALESQYWLPIKQEILNQTRCGLDLSERPVLEPIKIHFIRRLGQTSAGFQIKVSAEQIKTSIPFSVISPNGKRLIEGKLLTKEGYQERESQEMLITPPSGIYQLELGSVSYPLIISLSNDNPWLVLSNKAKPKLALTMPETPSNCANAFSSWQWFDSQYQQLGRAIPISDKIADIPSPHHESNGAEYLSASVKVREYQNGIAIDYVHRMSIPYTPEPAK
ncbi:hypothetical protein VINI7043_22347 [Vibrio nigripulchritudo ATCC 27043]|uniref:DUF2861 family protein n=1 Tax=Vibrio nigripulchritudo TaxID=28173 RepID=UPI00021C298D|nr:DUF2861 family protein [Vibrio nigripulchritudo]EGU61567.1 hypothetical protein VINI7043_22347 [Vibrio nigripulchritudo ATCC 27043]